MVDFCFLTKKTKYCNILSFLRQQAAWIVPTVRVARGGIRPHMSGRRVQAGNAVKTGGAGEQSSGRGGRGWPVPPTAPM